ncbi:GD18061 [Drosophila simulans]|uniref:GD18061 n=1 Tax=Drosophila simulans TaxID=7240 RepID=B4QY39_DROSI|nr:GD18061 [Drosophila simulans]
MQHVANLIGGLNEMIWLPSIQASEHPSIRGMHGPVDLSTFLNHGLSDNEMRDLSVTFYGSSAINRQKLGLLALSSATLALSLLVA